MSELVQSDGQQMMPRPRPKLPAAKHHPQWELMRVISGHTGWVRSLSVDPGNKWFASGSADRTIKIWDLAAGSLKVTLTGHISAVRALQVSDRHPYLFSAGEDKMVKCWDLEQNKVVRHYHGHLSGVQALALHPTLDVLVTGGRDCCPRVWDIRTKQPIHTMTGHRGAITSLLTNECDPQVISASHDSTIRLWDLAAGKTITELTHHKKSLRALCQHPDEFTMASASPDKVKKWGLPPGTFLHDFQGGPSDASAKKFTPNTETGGMIINTLSVNADGVMFGGGDDGRMRFWDWDSTVCFQETRTTPQPGSLDSEAGILASTFDRSGLRLLTGEVDKSIKVWREVTHDE